MNLKWFGDYQKCIWYIDGDEFFCDFLIYFKWFFDIFMSDLFLIFVCDVYFSCDDAINYVLDKYYFVTNTQFFIHIYKHASFSSNNHVS